MNELSLQPICISIPDRQYIALYGERVPKDQATAFATRVHGLVCKAGADPDRMLKIPIFPSLSERLFRGEITEGQFVENCRKLAVFNGH